MAEKLFVNPKTGLLRCPINGFRDCVKGKCFFWREPTELDLMYEHLRPTEITDRSEFEKDNCLLLVMTLLAEPFVFATRLVLEAHDALPDMPPPPEPIGRHRARPDRADPSPRARP